MIDPKTGLETVPENNTTTTPALTNIPTQINSTIAPTGNAVLNKSATPIWEWMKWSVWNGQNFEMPPIKVPAPITTPVIETPKTTAPITTPVIETPSTTTIDALKVWEQADLKKNEDLRLKTIKDQENSYITAKADYDKNANYYSNYNDINTRYNWVMADRRDALVNSPDWLISDTQAQQIASKYGITPDEVKNPTAIFKGLTPTDEGKRVLWVTDYENKISDSQKAFDRQKEDISTNLENTTTNINNQLDDVKTQLDRNIGFATASGAWNWWLKSSGYLQGIQNMKDDWAKTVQRLQQQLETIKTADAKDVARLTEDYNTGITRAKQAFDDSFNKLKQDSWLQLTGLTDTYWIGSKELTKALDDINAKYGASAMDITSKYLSNIKAVNDITNQNITTQENLNKLTDQTLNRRYTELLSNNGAILQNTSLKSLWDEVTNWTITTQKFNDLKNIMVQSVTSSLWKLWTVTTDDLNSITHMIEAGKTPTEVMAAMQTTWKFATAASSIKDKFEPLSDGNYYDKVNQKIITKDEMIAKVNQTQSAPTVTDTKSIIDYSVAQRWRTNLQCGELVNDYWKQQTGNKAWIWDTIQSKIDTVNNIWASAWPIAWGIFVSNPLGNSVGHTWIVQSVNSDGSITVLEANAQWKAEWQPPITKTYSAAQAKWMIFSKAPTKTNVTVTATAWNTLARPDVNNNPWNLKMWDVGYWVDDQWHTKFANATDWANALIKDLTAKATWNTKTWLNWDSTLAQLGSKYATDPNWAKNVASISWYSLGTQLKDMNISKLAQWIARQEWFSWTITWETTATTWTYTTTQENIMKWMDPKSLTTNELKILSDNGLKASDLYNYKATPTSTPVWVNAEYTQVAQELIDWKTKVSDLKSLQYSPDEIKQIQDEKLRLESTKWWELSKDDESLVAALKNYTLDPAKLPWGMSKEWQASRKRILAAAFGDPEFDMKKYSAKQKVYNSWTSWPMQVNNNWITTVTRHMMELEPALKALENGDIQKFNELWNTGSTQFWVADPNNAEMVSTAVASEMAKVYKWTASPTEDEIKEWKSKIATKLSSWQAKGLIDTMSKLLYGKITSNAQNYTRTMWEKPESIFDEESADFLHSHWVNIGKDFKVENLYKPTKADIQASMPKIQADIKAGKSLEEMKAHVKDLWVDPSYLDSIYNSGKWPVAPKNNPLNLNL